VVELVDDGGRAWAGKLLHQSHESDERARHRFEVEAKLLAGIEHPNLISIFGLVDVDGHAALLMELVPGPDLARVIACAAPLATDRVVGLGRGIAAGLAVAHRAGLVHRDLKPANILLGQAGEPKVGDFGLARAASFAASDPEAVAVAGTPDYMAPESIDPLAIDTRSDLYALGCILCELATGLPPYRGATAFAILEAHRSAELPVLDGVADSLKRVIHWLLAKSPADRPQSASEVERALASVATTSSALALTSVAAEARRSCTRCGAFGPAVVNVCFACGAAQLEVGRGPATVFVTGPGSVADKLDAGLRQKLLGWLAANPAVGLVATRALAKEVPRLPFVLVTGIDEPAARALVTTIQALGLDARVERGGRLALPEMRAKGWALARRVAAIGMSFWGLAQWGHLGGFAVAGASIVIASLWGGFVRGSRPTAMLSRERRTLALPSALDASFARVAAVVPAMTAPRHRDSLRGVLERVLALRAALDPALRETLEPQLAELVDHAALASSRLDQLEAELSPDDLRSADQAKRASWQQRDRWAARILQVTAFLDAMRARAVMARARVAAQADVDELRGYVDALAELEAAT
jgi:hypothetical protein